MEALKIIEQLRQLDTPLNNETSPYKICSIISFIYVKKLFTKDFCFSIYTYSVKDLLLH